MTRDQLPEKLRNLDGLEMFDPTQGKRKVVVNEAGSEALAKVIAPLLEERESA